MKMCAILIGSILWSLCAAGQMNTVKLDALMQECRGHMVPDPQAKQWVWDSGWENCRFIEQAWDMKQNGAVPVLRERQTPDEINEAVSNMLMAK